MMLKTVMVLVFVASSAAAQTVLPTVPATPVPSMTRTPTSSLTTTVSRTPSTSFTPSPSRSASPTSTPTATPTNTQTATPTSTPTATRTTTPTRSPTPTKSSTPTATPTATPTGTPTTSPSRTPSATPTRTPSPAMKQWGGDAETAGLAVHIIWYGAWNPTSSTPVPVVKNLVQNMGMSPYWGVLSSYGIASDVAVGTFFNDQYSKGKTLASGDIRDIVVNAIAKNSVPADPNGMYVVIASSEVVAHGHCTQYCGFHSHAFTVNSYKWLSVPYIFIGSPSRCVAKCAKQTTVSPNSDVAADAISTILAHQLAATATNPLGDAWQDKLGKEVGTKCQNAYGTTSTTRPNGSLSNMRLGSLYYYLQQLWVNTAQGYCTLAYVATSGARRIR